jgi:Zn-dependent protease
VNSFEPALLGEFAIWYVVFLFSLTLHEGAHALVAWWGGDDTAYRGGQVTLNPWPHLRREPFGTVLVPLFTFFSMGWMMGWASTPYDPHWGQRHPRRQALMSLAGPSANLLFAGVAFVVLKIFLAGGLLTHPVSANFSHLVAAPPGTPAGSLLLPLALLLSVAVNLNVLLGLFNLIPLPPLDGAGFLEGLLPGPASHLFGLLRANSMLSILSLLAAWKIFGLIAEPVFSLVLRLAHPGVLYS